MAREVFTAPLAIIKINGKAVGKIRNLSFTENMQRGEVTGLGEVTLKEAPVTMIRCQFQAGSYLIDLKKFGTIKDPFWPTGSTDNLDIIINSILLGEKPVDIHVFKKIPKTISADSYELVTEVDQERVAVISECYLNSKSWEISEQNLGGKQISGIYFNPVFLM